jgi:hypothetical protein
MPAKQACPPRHLAFIILQHTLVATKSVYIPTTYHHHARIL